MRIVSITSSRADVGILRPVWKALSERGCDLHVIATGMHRAPGAAPVDCGGIGVELHSCGQDIGGRADAAAARAVGEIASECGALYARLQPDGILVMGDRLDMLPAAVAALPFNIPLAHLHGGEVTEGAVDDRARHAMTVLAGLHLVSCPSAAAKVRSLGADESRTVITGAPGLDTLREAEQLSRAEFLSATGLERIAGAQDAFILATVHPETNSPDPQAPMAAVLNVLSELKCPVLFTAPNSDPGGADMRQTLNKWLAQNPFAHFVDTLGSRLYPNALRHAVAMLGNSSSGVIEAGIFGLPVVDVGDRQKGRERGENVINVASRAEDAGRALAQAMSMGRYKPGSPYGTGQSAARVAEALLAYLPRAKVSRGLGE